MITAREAVEAAAATYGGKPPSFSGCAGAVCVYVGDAADGSVNVAVEGTHTTFGWALDFAAWPAEAKVPAVVAALPLMHAGFHAAIDAVIADVRQAVAGRRWNAIGHSLGGAVAQGLAAQLAAEGAPPQAAYMFAPARIFYDAPDVLAGVPLYAWRCADDVVPMVPSWCWRPVMTHFPGPSGEAAHAIGNFLEFIR